MAHAYRVVQVPDVWWQSDTNADAYTYSDCNTDSNSDPNADSDSDSKSDTSSGAERPNEPCWQRDFDDSGESVVDG